MKLLYIVSATPNSGYWNSGIEYIKAIHGAGVDIVARFIPLGKQSFKHSEVIQECVNKDLNNITHCIQHGLPHQFHVDNKIKNYGLFFWETSNIDYTSWPEFITAMDGILCPNEKTFEAAKKYNKNCVLIGHPVDFNKFDGIKPIQIKEFQDNFNFYFIGEAVCRKNIHSLCIAFHSEFGPDEPVNLIIKTHKNGMNSNESLAFVKDICLNSQHYSKKYKEILDYKKEIIITDFWTDKQLLGLHLAADCFVMPSYGEGFCLPFYDALVAKKPVIYTQNAGIYHTNLPNSSVPSQKSVVFGEMQTFHDLYTSNEYWQSISTYELAKTMRKAYEETDKFQTEVNLMQNYLTTCHSPDRIGKEIARVLQ